MSKRLSFKQYLQQINALSDELIDDLPSEKQSILEHLSTKKNQNHIEKETIAHYLQDWENNEDFNVDSIESELCSYITEKSCRRYNLIPMCMHNDYLLIACKNPYDTDMLNFLNSTLSIRFRAFLADTSEIIKAIDLYYRKTHQIAGLAEKATKIYIKPQQTLTINEGINRSHNSASVVNLVDMIIDDAIQCSATDIHIESNDSKLIYYYRLGHESSNEMPLPQDISPMVLQRIIVIADGDIAERNIPQDLSLTHRVKNSGTTVNIRVSVLYTLHGFSIVMRLLRSNEKLLEPEKLLHDSATESIINQFLTNEHGMMLVTGPTASGKTTLLYSILKSIHSQSKKIISIEDPVEIAFEHLNQVQVNADIGLDFADVIRSSLRQNPDVLMIGEIRDQVSANMALRAAMTGVLVFSTLHTPSAAKTVTRLLDLGVNPFLLSSSLKVVVATRLLKLNCTHCRTPREQTTEEKSLFSGIIPEKTRLHTAQGCAHCNHTGIEGLTLISEYLTLNDELQHLIMTNQTAEFTQTALKMSHGQRLQDKAARTVIKGDSPPSELIKLVCDI